MPDGPRTTRAGRSARRFLTRSGLLLVLGVFAACSPQDIYRRTCEGKGLQAGTPPFAECLARERAAVERMGRSRRGGGP